jgi:hypothetical protein
MKTIRLLRPLLLAAALGTGLFAAEKEKAGPAAKTDTYPLKTCVVSGEALGSMGDFVTYVHKQAGQPDREIRFCCEGCIDDFKADPAKFLKKLDEAAAAKKSAGASTAKPESGHAAAKEHQH